MATNLMMTSVGDAGKALPVPARIPNLVLWLDATVGVFQDIALATPAINNNDPVKGWKDQSGNGYDHTASAGQFSFLTNLQNSLPGIRNSATGNRLSNSSLPFISPGSTCVFAVNQTASGGTNHGGVFMNQSGGSDGFDMDGINLRFLCTGTTSSASIYSLNTPTIFSVTLDGSASTVKVNDVSVGMISASASTVSTTASNVGWNQGFGASAYFIGNFFEIIYYSRELTTTEQTSLYNYLHTKWSI